YVLLRAVCRGRCELTRADPEFLVDRVDPRGETIYLPSWLISFLVCVQRASRDRAFGDRFQSCVQDRPVGKVQGFVECVHGEAVFVGVLLLGTRCPVLGLTRTVLALSVIGRDRALSYLHQSRIEVVDHPEDQGLLGLVHHQRDRSRVLGQPRPAQGGRKVRDLLTVLVLHTLAGVHLGQWLPLLHEWTGDRDVVGHLPTHPRGEHRASRGQEQGGGPRCRSVRACAGRRPWGTALAGDPEGREDREQWGSC